MNGQDWARLVAVAIVALVLQVAVLDQIVLLGAHADLLVLLVAAAALVGGPQAGAMAGFLVGLLADLAVDTPYGLSALTFVLVGFSVGLLRSIPAGREAGLAQAAACVAAGTAGTLLFAVVGALVGQPGMLGHEAADALIVVTIGGLVLAPVALAAMRWVFVGDRRRASRAVPRGGSAA